MTPWVTLAALIGFQPPLPPVVFGRIDQIEGFEVTFDLNWSHGLTPGYALAAYRLDARGEGPKVASLYVESVDRHQAVGSLRSGEPRIGDFIRFARPQPFNAPELNALIGSDVRITLDTYAEPFDVILANAEADPGDDVWTIYVIFPRLGPFARAREYSSRGKLRSLAADSIAYRFDPSSRSLARAPTQHDRDKARRFEAERAELVLWREGQVIEQSRRIRELERRVIEQDRRIRERERLAIEQERHNQEEWRRLQAARDAEQARRDQERLAAEQQQLADQRGRYERQRRELALQLLVKRTGKIGFNFLLILTLCGVAYFVGRQLRQ